LSYDAYRDRLLYCDGFASGGLVGVDWSGNVAAVISNTANTPSLAVARGDGRIYCWYSYPEGFSVIDASGNITDLLDETGMARFRLGGTGKQLQQLLYYSATNTLFGFCGQVSSGSPCADSTLVCVLAIPLTPAGNQVAGPTRSSQYLVEAGSQNVVGASVGPGSNILFTVDTNLNQLEPRMLLLDPASMGISVYAQNGPYTGSAATNAGTYSHVIDRALILDTLNDSLRVFMYGEMGRGTTLTPLVSSGGSSGEFARLIEIDSSNWQTAGVAASLDHTAGARLEPAAPDPFRETTALRWSQPAPGGVTLRVVDVAGRRVRTLLEGAEFSPGEHGFNWDGRTDAGAEAPPGFYETELLVAGHRDMRPVVRLR
ncbi:MAG: FlgD immunoglobulin-like domain containing protein, partial [Gaiellaceae bacterium]